MPDAPEMGPLHRLPRLRWRTWVRLALIPAGGDWRALGLRREGAFNNTYRIVPWDAPSGAVTSGMGPSASGGCVADPRITDDPRTHHNKFRVERFDQPSHTITGSDRVGSGAPSVADPRFERAFHRATYGVRRFDEPGPTITGRASASTGAFTVADPRIEGKGSRPNLFGVLAWDEPAKTITGSATVSSSNTSAAVADPRIPDPDDFPDPPPIIVAEDGTWHRPLTTLELAALQGLPIQHPNGAPLILAGKSHSRWRERIGNAVPVQAAQAIARQMLETLELVANGRTFGLGGTEVWVRRPPRFGARIAPNADKALYIIPSTNGVNDP